MTRVKVTIPATTANLGPGFDCLGLALGLYNEVRLEVAAAGLKITVEGEGSSLLPTNGANLVARAADLVFEKIGRRPPGLTIRQSNQIPVGSGLGSSAAAVVGGIVGAAALLGEELPPDEMVRLAVELEGHPDNVAPALHGGLILINRLEHGYHLEQMAIAAMRVSVVLPDFKLSTRTARAALPASVPIPDAVFNAGRVGLLLKALETGDYRKLSVAMQDRLHQPYRRRLIPGMKEALEAGRKAGAAAVVLSGAGPSVAAFAPDRHQEIVEAIVTAFGVAGLSSRAWTLPVDRQGCQLQRLPS